MKEPLRHHTGDPEAEAYEYYSGGYYGEWLDEDVLDFEGADYIWSPGSVRFSEHI